jgi:AraC-like DNA-binding protein
VGLHSGAGFFVNACRRNADLALSAAGFVFARSLVVSAWKSLDWARQVQVRFFILHQESMRMNIVAESTDHVAPQQCADHWCRTIAEAYFPLHLSFRDAARFSGRLERRELGPVSLSRLRTEALSYERQPRHLRDGGKEEYLIAIPARSPIEFRQLGRDVRCDPGGFIVERGNEPYRFAYHAANDLCVLKVSKQTLSEKLSRPDRFCAQVFDGRTGIGNLFSETARQLQVLQLTDRRSAHVLGRQLVELLALTLDQETGDDEQVRSSVQAAHLRRAKQVIIDTLPNQDLSPSTVANACGISKRYLHELFSSSNTTVSQFIREQRLAAARDALQLTPHDSIADVAYRFGFSDQAQFSRLFRAMFDVTPSGFRASQRS